MKMAEKSVLVVHSQQRLKHFGKGNKEKKKSKLHVYANAIQINPYVEAKKRRKKTALQSIFFS